MSNASLDSTLAAPSSSRCNGKLLIYVSKNGNPAEKTFNITVDPGVARYYLHVYNADLQHPCSTVFDVRNNAGQAVPWGVYRSNQNGIARIDLSTNPPIPNGTYKAVFKPRGLNVAWSNEISVTINNSGSRVSPTGEPLNGINLSDYVIYRPGNTYIFHSINNRTGEVGTTRLQIEEERTIHGVSVIPWCFTKSSTQAYWRHGFNQDLRWMIVAPDNRAGTGITSGLAHFDRYIWALCDRRYERNTVNPIRDINKARFLGGYYYLTTTGRVPGYNLAPKVAVIPYLDFAKGESYSSPYDINVGPPNIKTSAKSNGSWKIRIERATVVTQYSTFSDAIRIDYFEGSNSLESGPLLRESWYFARHIGLVKIEDKTFNNYAGDGSLNCADDSDYLSDTMAQPSNTITLYQYYNNPRLFVQVSTDGATFSSSINTTRSAGYYVKVQPNYTGYLEARIYNNTTHVPGAPVKWLWVENGIVKANIPTIPLGTYTADFRIWAPNELFPGESRIREANIAWSNTITVKVVQ